jgi:hypothetical protein
MSPATFSCPRTSKSSRRGRPLGPTAVAIRSAVMELVDRFERMTVRQVFYALEVQGVVEKTEGGYRQVQAQVLRMRRDGRDGGGRRAARTIARELPEHAPGVPIEFDLLAVTDEQIADWNLPTRPAKQSDPEAAKFTGPAVELDAIPPDKLVQIVENAIVEHIEPHAWQVQQAVENEERRGLLRLAEAVA